MQFEDRILVQLGDAATRQALFTPGLAERLVAAAFGADGPYAAPFSFGATTVTLGVRAVEEARLRATWRMADGRIGGEVDAVLPSFSAPESGLVAAVVEGTVAASMAPVTGRIAAGRARTAELPSLAAIEAGVPASERADPAAFERRRRVLLGQAVGGALADDEAAGLADRTLAGAGAGTVAEFLALPAGPAAIARLALRYELTDPGPAAQQTTQFVAGVLIRELAAAPGLASLMQLSREVQRALRSAGRGTAPLAGLAPRHAVPVIWFIPQAGFGDADWPGADGAAREGRATAWLAEQGVALMGV